LRAAFRHGAADIDLPLLQGFPLTADEIAALQHTVCDYLWHSAFASGVTLEAPAGAEWFKRNAARLRQLPCVTPNGVVIPKIETTAAYNLMHHIVVSIVYQGLNPDEVAAVFAPINVRLVDGKPDAKIDARPRASTKVHSDIWAAEPSRSMTMFLTVMGDSETTTVDFLEPASFPAEWHRPLPDYGDGAAVAQGATRYPACFRNDRVLAMDAICLHRTIKSGGGYRLSLDFRVLFRKRLDSDAYFDTPRLQNYLSPPLWAGLGVSHMLVSRKSIKEFVPDVTLDAFASRYDVCGL
jgi:hypothetical protein